ncbi:MAG TPA: hypothetical protein VEH31_34140 [Streptosporangiaceae bacterium]|nr:hypothetical protein [Streptosporangiaceae bacterium]
MTRIRRLAAALFGLAGALLAFSTAAPAAFASGQPPPHLPPGHIHQPVHLPPVPVPAHTVVIGGMPGWQIALIAAGAALAAAAVAILVDRAWVSRKAHATTA